MSMNPPSYCRVASLAGFVTGLGLAFLIPPAHAFQFSRGEFKGAFDSTLSFGGMYRLKDPHPDFYGLTTLFNGVPGRQTSVNTDDGNVNYGRGWISELLKGSHDLELRYRDFGVLVRGYW